MASKQSPDPGGIITLTTDFGSGHYAGAMKGALLEVCPEAVLVDITHEIRPHDILEGAFTLLCTYPYFPKGTIHVAVVDPGVGSDRRGIIVTAGGQTFVGPDNGLFSLVYRKETVESVVSLEEEAFFRKPCSETFHGRDIFAPAAGWLARGTPPEKFGTALQDYTVISIPPVKQVSPNRLQGSVIHIDRFGNVITDLSALEASRLLGPAKSPRFRAGGQEIREHRRFYAGAAPGVLFSLVGSCGYFELAASGESAAARLGIQRGDPIEMEIDPEPPSG